MRRPVYLLGACILATACTLPTAEQQLTISVVEDSVDVDVLCEVGDCSPAEVTLEMALEDASWMSSDATFELMQYRIDYDAIDAEVPFYANDAEGSVSYGDSLEVTLVAAGPQQRDAAYALEGGGELSGTATLTIAGVDYNDGVHEASADFEVVFANLSESDDTGVSR